MTLVKFDRDEDNVVSGSYSTGTGPVLRSEKMEVTKISFAKGKGADTHQHAEEQVMYVLEGRLRVTCDGETYEVGPGRGDLQPVERPAQRDGDRGRRRAELQEPGGADLRAHRESDRLSPRRRGGTNCAEWGSWGVNRAHSLWGR